MSAGTESYHPPIAVVDEQTSQIAVWHVDISGVMPPRMSRLTGAWVLKHDALDTLSNLITNHYVVRCAPAPSDSILDGIAVAGWIDLDATVDAVRSELRELDKRFDEYLATSKSKLVRPEWPAIEDPRTADLRPVISPGDPTPAEAVALDLARGIRNLADAWAQIEVQRAMRAFLVEPAGKAARPLVLVVR
ncbi:MULTISPECIES: hypothetical protein [Rhodococcus]|uniref:hypothetical protein n=1 Tax=Rhodococcus TaxID=1827 RepID=UPI0011A7D82E|nr:MULTISPECIES: hypothetical protein [Rhodococcus]MDC3728937.1 hypothetical protein [Rhodococcus sp. Rp3]TWH63210.1 hypothetical protein L612_001000001620 [Rhodococcus rhodochrous J38]